MSDDDRWSPGQREDSEAVIVAEPGPGSSPGDLYATYGATTARAVTEAVASSDRRRRHYLRRIIATSTLIVVVGATLVVALAALID